MCRPEVRALQEGFVELNEAREELRDQKQQKKVENNPNVLPYETRREHAKNRGREQFKEARDIS